jgi:hypothetical protein
LAPIERTGPCSELIPVSAPLTYVEPCTSTANPSGGGFRVHDGNGSLVYTETP